MASVKDIPADQFIVAFAAHLKKSGKLELPSWADIVKTGPGRELAPIDPDWFYVRSAALARKVYLFPNRGVGSYSKVFGGSQRRGALRPRTRKASCGVIRNALQQLEKLGLVEQAAKGRKITSKGQKELDTIAHQVATAQAKFSVWNSTF